MNFAEESQRSSNESRQRFTQLPPEVLSGDANLAAMQRSAEYQMSYEKGVLMAESSS